MSTSTASHLRQGAPAPDAEREVAIRFEGVGFSYDGELPTLRDVSLEIRDRETVCIIGPNGGGKTTLLKLLLGILRPGSGTIEIFGQPPRKARYAIGYMPQYMTFDPQFPITVMEIVLMGRLDRRRFGFYRASDREVARAALAEVGMDGRENRPFSALSGGQRQRVLIARALACEPRILLLDEPTANVDQKVEEQLFETLDRLKRKMTVVMVSHDLGVVTSMAENVICVNREVHTHPTSSLTGRSIEEIWGMKALAIHHRHGECHEHHHHDHDHGDEPDGAPGTPPPAEPAAGTDPRSAGAAGRTRPASHD